MDTELVISPYDNRWPDDFKLEQATLHSVFDSGSVIIEHIGSTSVPKLAAKPVIDIIVGVEELVYAENLIPKLNDLGYLYVPEYETALPERRYFRKSDRHLHCVLPGSSFWIDHLLFREFLRNYPTVAADYSLLKKSLAEKHSRNHRAYTEGKSKFIADVLNKARNVRGVA